jgi:chromosome segregation ATPase
MTQPRTANDVIFERLAEGLDSTSKLTHALLTEIRESEADFSAIKTEMAILKENVKSLSVIVREGNGAASLLTQIALLEQKVENIDKWIESHMAVHQRSKDSLEDVKERMAGLTTRLSNLEKEVHELVEYIEEGRRSEIEDMRIDLQQKKDLEHQKEKSAEKVKEERQAAIIKFLVALIIAIITFSVAWSTKEFFSG